MVISDDLRLVAQAQAQIVANELRSCELYLAIAEGLDELQVADALRRRQAAMRRELEGLVDEYFPEMAALFGVANKTKGKRSSTIPRKKGGVKRNG